MEQEQTFQSYKSLFKINFTIYNFGDRTLPVPIPLEIIAMMAIFFIPFYPVGSLLQPEHPVMCTLFLSGLGAYVLTNVDLQGKFMPAFFFDFFNYLTKPKVINFAGERIKPGKKLRAKWIMGEVME